MLNTIKDTIINTIKETMSNKETIINTIKETLSNKEAHIYLVIGIVIAYYLFNLVSSILKYPIIIIFGIILGNLIKKKSLIQNE